MAWLATSARLATLSRMSPVVGGEWPRGKEFYMSGPWLIIFSHGLQSESWAREIARQCHVLGVA